MVAVKGESKKVEYMQVNVVVLGLLYRVIVCVKKYVLCF